MIHILCYDRSLTNKSKIFITKNEIFKLNQKFLVTKKIFLNQYWFANKFQFTKLKKIKKNKINNHNLPNSVDTRPKK